MNIFPRYFHINPLHSGVLVDKLSSILSSIFLSPFPVNAVANFQKAFGKNIPFSDTDLWHSDRFIACIGAQYYPFGCNWMPTERVSSSPKIDSPQIAMKLQRHYEDIDDHSLYTSADIVKQFCSPNTLYIAWHHLPHRRAPASGPGERTVIFFEHYNIYGKLRLLSEFCKSFYR